mmetsp:Transcript_96068/g.256701  ORF Transcript_96068/g.256701 Transcript_96068/m.256701 type:complete len:423 (+) Transcript_96068:1367-2635(+)
MYAKQKWLQGDVGKAREILGEAFGHSKDSEAISLAAVKLESENGEIQRARLLLNRARQQCDTAKVWMQSVQLEREQTNYAQALALCEEGLAAHPHFAKLWMIGGQIYMEQTPPQLAEARRFFERAVRACPKSVPVWLCAAECEILDGKFPKARSLLEKARIKNPKSELLWLRGVEVESMDGQERVALHMMSKALQECPSSGVLWAHAIDLEPKPAQNAKSVDALKKCENDADVIVAVAQLFWRDGKIAKARKWFMRAVQLNPALGHAWGGYMAFELSHGDPGQQRDVLRRFCAAEPNQGIRWTKSVKKVKNWRLKWPQKMMAYLQEYWQNVLEFKPLDKEIEALLKGEELPAADVSMEAASAEIKDTKEAKEERKIPAEFFEAADRFSGPRQGWEFKTGSRGLGYYKTDPTKNEPRIKEEPL